MDVVGLSDSDVRRLFSSDVRGLTLGEIMLSTSVYSRMKPMKDARLRFFCRLLKLLSRFRKSTCHQRTCPLMSPSRKWRRPPKRTILYMWSIPFGNFASGYLSIPINFLCLHWSDVCLNPRSRRPTRVLTESSGITGRRFSSFPSPYR